MQHYVVAPTHQMAMQAMRDIGWDPKTTKILARPEQFQGIQWHQGHMILMYLPGMLSSALSELVRIAYREGAEMIVWSGRL